MCIRDSSKGRLEVTVVGQMKTLKQQSVDVTLHEKLRASSKESPVTCIAVFRGDKLVKLESLS